MRKYKDIVLLISLVILLLLLSYLGVVLGYMLTSFSDLIDSLTNFDGSQLHIVLLNSRIPRTLNALLTGAALGVSGLMLQALTKNQLASASVLGINSGATFFVVAGMFFLPSTSWSTLNWFAFLGAILTSVLVYTISGGLGGKVDKKALVLGGTAISALLFSLTQAFLYSNNAALEDVLYWMTGSVEGKKLETILHISPYIVIGLIACLFLYKSFNIFMLGDEMASSLGMNIFAFKIIVVLIVSVLCGSSVALAGPIAFVCLITPYVARRLFGSNYFVLIPASMLIGSIILIASDILSRFIIYPKELPVGALTALLGGTFFIYLFLEQGNQNAKNF